MEGNGYNQADLILDFAQMTPQQHQRRQSYLQTDLQQQIMNIIDENQKKECHASEILSVITDDLQILCRTLEEDINVKSLQETLRIRTHQLAINKILVLTHGKTDFRLVMAHFKIGKAYVDYGCFQQAIDHLTIASTKIVRLSDIKQTKLYNSCILTALSRCYYLIGGYEHSLDIVMRAYQIQSANQSSQGGKSECIYKETLELLAWCYLKLENKREAVKVIDRLVDTMTMQFVELQGLYRKLVVVVNISSEWEMQNNKELRSTNRPRHSGLQFCKILQLLLQKLDYVVIECNKQSLRQLLEQLLSEVDLQRDITLVNTLISSVGEVITLLGEEIKKQRIFKFNVLVGDEGMTSSLDQELKGQYEQQRGNPESFKKLTRAETIELYKLQVHYCARFVDYQSQLGYLKKLEQIYMQEQRTVENRLNLLKVKRNLAMLYGQRQMQKNSEQILQQIRVQIYGVNSDAVKKTIKMIKMIQMSESRVEEESLYRSAQSHTSQVSRSEEKRRTKSKLRKTIVINGGGNSVPSKLGPNRLIL